MQYDRPGNRVDSEVGTAGMDALQRRESSVIVQVDDEAFALEPRRSLVEPEIDHCFDALAHPLGRDLSRETKPGGRPRRTPGRPSPERFEVFDVWASLDRQRSPMSVHEGQDPLAQLALDALLDQVTIGVHSLTLLRHPVMAISDR